jgi:hypothetical protein
MRKTIFCDAYGTQISKKECRRCPLRKDCTKIKLNNLSISKYKILKYS